jgi:hypothetical protein
MKKSALALTILVIFTASTLTASAASVGSQTMTGTNPPPLAVTGTNPPPPSVLTELYSALRAYFRS